MFQGDECSRGMSVLGDGCLGGWEFLLPTCLIRHDRSVNGYQWWVIHSLHILLADGLHGL